jgi:predicted ferric reductase
MARATFEAGPAPLPRGGRLAYPTRRAPEPRPWALDVAAVTVAVGFGACVGLALTAQTASELRAPGGWFMFLGSLTGLTGTYLAMVMLLLVGRIPAVERVVGQDGLVRWHKRLAPWPVSLIAAHVVLVTVGYADAAHAGALAEVATLVGTFPDMVTATIAFVVMLSVAGASARIIRSRIRRERWWAFHLLMYLVLALAFAHEIALGPSFVGHPLTRWVWGVAWLATAGAVLAFRVAVPVVRSVRHRVEVVEVRPEGPGVVSVILRGRNLSRLAVSGGQFFEWRFLARGMWWQAHPFSISALPRPPYLRLTVKEAGDFTVALRQLKPGTRVAIEGPYGAFTARARHRPRAALIAGGVGATAVRSLLEDLPARSGPVVVLRVSRAEDLVLADEIQALADRCRGRVHRLVGSRLTVPVEEIARLVPDLAERDVFVSGSESFVLDVAGMARRLGVAREALHYEIYSL